MRKLLVLLCAGDATLAAQKIVGGPIVVNTTARTATVVWIVQGDELILRTAAGEPRK